MELVLGRRELDGRRRPGLVDRLGAGADLIEEVAAECEEKGRLEVAVRLFDLADKSGRVIRLLNGLLSGVVAQPPAPGSNRQRIGDLVRLPQIPFGAVQTLIFGCRRWKSALAIDGTDAVRRRRIWRLSICFLTSSPSSAFIRSVSISPAPPLSPALGTETILNIIPFRFTVDMFQIYPFQFYPFLPQF